MNRKLYSILITALLLAVGAVSCGERRLGPELVRINSIADGITGAHTDEDMERWREADSLLRSTDTSRLSENNRMYHSLLRVKVTDKAYLPHSGDTIIRPVVEYAEKHPRCGFYPEALYYAGRVYSDIGDSFTALSYFQKALDNFPENERNRNLRCRILSQTSALLNSLRLYNEAIAPLEDCIAINKFLKDSLNLFYNYQDLSAVNLHLENFDRAEYLLKESLTYSGAVTRDDSLVSVTYLAGVKEAKENIDSALLLIRGIPEQVTDSLTRNMVLAYASDIYRKAGINDTSLFYAHELMNNGNPNNKIIGYQNLLKKENFSSIPPDSLLIYLQDYAEELNRDLNSNSDRLALIQQAQYNYALHDRMRREEEERSSLYFRIGAAAAIMLIITIAAIVIISLNRKKEKAEYRAATEKINNQINRLMESLNIKDGLIRKLEDTERDNNELIENLKSERDRLESELTEKRRLLESDPDHQPEMNRELHHEEKRERSDILREKYLEYANKIVERKQAYRIPQRILSSDAYKRMTALIEKGKDLSSYGRLWNDLDLAVEAACPNYKKDLTLLMRGKLNETRLHTVILIKCGMRTSDIAKALNIQPGSVSSRRQEISEKIFGENKGAAVVDAVIQGLGDSYDS